MTNTMAVALLVFPGPTWTKGCGAGDENRTRVLSLGRSLFKPRTFFVLPD